MSEITQSRIRAAVVALAPLLLLIGVATMPYVADRTDKASLVGAVRADSDRFLLALLLISGSMVLTFLSVYSIRFALRSAGEERWSFIAVPLVVAGGVALTVAYSLLMGVAIAMRAGADGTRYLEAADPWFMPLTLGGALLFGLGWLSLAAAILRSDLLGRDLSRLVAAGFIVVGIATFIPTGWAGYLIAVAALVASWPIAYHMYGHTMTTGMMGARPAHA